MRILASSRSLSESVGPFAVGLGIFDGVHLGHRALLARVRDLADADGVDSLVYTFNPHPAKLLVPERAPRLLEPIENRLEIFSTLGIGAVMVERFDREFAAIPAETFIDTVLVQKLRARHVVVGAGFTFGAGGKGTTALLEAQGRRAGFATHIQPAVTADGEVVSSTRIRRLVASGDLGAAQRLLGRPFTLVGLVMRGVMRGQKLGFPTANLEVANETLPATGVYVARALGTFGEHGAVVNVGYTPTFGADKLKIEAHLLDFPFQPLYGQQMSLLLLEKLRDEQRFDGPDSLKAQIRRDLERARTLLANAA
jgi:riboflavin kinase/FMN adenylyltransferase